MTHKVIFFQFFSILKLIIINSSWWPRSCRLCLVYSLRVSPTNLATNWQAGGLNGDPVKCEPVSWTTSATIALSTAVHGLYDISWKESSFCRDSRLHPLCMRTRHVFEYRLYFLNDVNTFESRPFKNKYAFMTFPTWLFAETLRHCKMFCK